MNEAQKIEEGKRLHDSWLVQRLVLMSYDEPQLMPKQAWALDKDGKFGDEAMAVRSKIYGYDYMGSSEFEFGEIGKFSKAFLNDAKSLISFQMKARVNYELWRENRWVTVEDAPIYVICRGSQKELVIERIPKLLTDGVRLKESMYLKDAFSPEPDPKAPNKRPLKRYVGWIELNNGFFFFPDKRTWECVTMLYTGKMPK